MPLWYRIWSSIPRKHKTVWWKIHTILSSIFTAALFLWVLSLWFSYVYNIAQEKNKPNIAILLDTSFSMSAKDVWISRYEHALNIISGVVTSIPASYSLITFWAIPMTMIPWTSDIEGFKHKLTQFNLWAYQINKQHMGSAPGSAIWLALYEFRKRENKQNTIIIFWDWNTNTWFDINGFLPHLEKDSIQVLFCVIWKQGNVLWLNHARSPVINEINSELEIWKSCNEIQDSIAYIKNRFQQNDTLTYESIHKKWLRNMQYVSSIALLYLITSHLYTLFYYIINTKK